MRRLLGYLRPHWRSVLLGLVVIFDVITRRTRWGRYVFAVGGNAEAARRAGISVTGIRVAVFAIASRLAASGGVSLAERLLAVTQSSGGGDLLLNAIAAAVIGGTSLMGGRGSVVGTVAGALLVGVLRNILALNNIDSNIQLLIIGLVIVLAAGLQRLRPASAGT